MSHYKATLSPLTETASKKRLNEYYHKQKGLQNPVYYLLPSNKWLQSARKRQPGMAFKTFDDLADLILRKAGVKYVSVTESERILFFQQLLNTKEGLNTIDNPHKAKAYAQTYGQLKRLGLDLEHLPKGLEKLKSALYLYEENWVKKQRLLDPENKFHEALKIEGVSLPIGEIVIDGYMDFSPLQYLMLGCLIKHQVPVTIYIPSIDGAEIIEETLEALKVLGFVTEEVEKSVNLNPTIVVKKAVSREEEIRGVLGEIAMRKMEATKGKLGIILTDDSYIADLVKMAEQNLLQIQIPKKTPVVETATYKIIALILKQQSFQNKWEKIALIDQLYQLMFYSPSTYWEAKRKYMVENKLDEEVEKRLKLSIQYRYRAKDQTLVEMINELSAFLDSLSLDGVWKQKILLEESTQIAKKIRMEWEALDVIKALLKGKREVLEEQGLQSLTININLFSQWLLELVRKKEIYVERKSAKGIPLYTFRDVALFKGDELYILGMNEGVFPGVNKLGGYLQDSDLKEMPVSFGVPSRATFRKKDEAMFQQLQYLAEDLHFSYVCGFDPENEYQPSPFIERYCDDNTPCFSGEGRYKNKNVVGRAQGIDQAAFMMGIGKKVSGAPAHLLEMDEHLKFLNKGIEEVSAKWTKDLISTEIAVTALEQYAGCPFKYGLERLLKIREPKAKQEIIDPMTTGSMLHKIVERFYREMDVIGKPFSSLCPVMKENGENLLLEIFEQEWKKIENNELLPHDLDMEKSSWTVRLKKWWMAEKEHFWDNDKLQQMQIYKLEETLELTIPVDSETNLTLRGKADRVDLDEKGFAIYDYKSGKATMNFPKEVVPGLKLQLLVYMASLEKDLKLPPHGGAYISLKTPNKRSTNSVWQKEQAPNFKATRANKEEKMDGATLFAKYGLNERIKDLWQRSSHDYSVKPLLCFPSCPYNGICRVTEDLKEEGENGYEV